MKRSSQPRTSVGLSKSLHQQLNAYALAASAAGVSLFALAQPSEAKIVYTPTHHVIHPNSSYSIDLNHDGINDFAIRNSLVSTGDFVHDDLYARPFSGNGVEGRGGVNGAAYALARGALIGPKQPFGAQLMLTYVYGFICLEDWCNATNRYLGLEFHVHGKLHYGWARLSVVEIKGKGEVTATLTGYAYETIPGKPIIAGRTKGPDEDRNDLEPTSLTAPTWKPATLGALALGAAGLTIWRHKEAVVAAPEGR
jgi:hypothetical protein